MNVLKNVTFITSVYDKGNLPNDDKAEIVLVGKSNVGKSSFINSLANQKKLAHVGNSPGKTRCINYYNIDEKAYLVDLPGYGYSKMSKQEKESINKLIDSFMNRSSNIKHIFLIVDIRHNPTIEDKQMYEWILSKNVPFSIIANKADKITKSKMDEYILNITKTLFAKEEIIPYSSETRLNTDNIVKMIEELL